MTIQLEATLNFTLTDKLSGLLDTGVPLADVVGVVEALGELLNGVNITSVDENLSLNTGGYYTSLAAALDISNIADVVASL